MAVEGTPMNNAAVPNIFGTRNWFLWKILFPQTGVVVQMVWDGSSALHLLCIEFLLLLHQLNLRSSGIRSQRVGTSDLMYLLLQV